MVPALNLRQDDHPPPAESERAAAVRPDTTGVLTVLAVVAVAAKIWR
jgi:hypothetical protein